MLNLALHGIGSLLNLIPFLGPPLGAVVDAIGTGLHFIGQGVIG